MCVCVSLLITSSNRKSKLTASTPSSLTLRFAMCPASTSGVMVSVVAMFYNNDTKMNDDDEILLCPTNVKQNTTQISESQKQRRRGVVFAVGGVKNAGLVRVVSTWWTAVINREGVSCM